MPFAESARRPTALIALSGGGFTAETRALLASLEPDFRFSYLCAPWGGEPGKEGIPAGPSRSIPAFGGFAHPSRRQDLYALAATFLTTCRVLLTSRIDVVVGVGSRHALPLLLAARLFGKRTVFVESFTRVDRLSRTGALAYHLRLARTFIVQWPPLVKLYPRSRLGSVL